MAKAESQVLQTRDKMVPQCVYSADIWVEIQTASKLVALL